MGSKEQLVTDFFNIIAENYDFVNLIISLGRCNYWRQFLIREIGELNGAILLDVCCGTGMVTMDLAKKAGPKGKVVGLDFSENMLAVAKRNLKKHNMDQSFDNARIQLIQGNAMALPFPENTFDYVTIAYGLRNVSDLRQALLEMKRVLKPGGQVASLEMARPDGRVLKKLYDLYAGKCIPLIGKALAKNKEPYRYLYQSILSYLNPEEVTNTFEELGFKHIKSYKLTMGVATIHLGVKP